MVGRAIVQIKLDNQQSIVNFGSAVNRKYDID